MRVKARRVEQVGGGGCHRVVVVTAAVCVLIRLGVDVGVRHGESVGLVLLLAEAAPGAALQAVGPWQGGGRRREGAGEGAC